MDFASLRVLVIDDSTTMVRIISNTLKRIGVDRVDTAYDGLAGFNKVKPFTPQVLKEKLEDIIQHI